MSILEGDNLNLVINLLLKNLDENFEVLKKTYNLTYLFVHRQKCLRYIKLQEIDSALRLLINLELFSKFKPISKKNLGYIYTLFQIKNDKIIENLNLKFAEDKEIIKIEDEFYYVYDANNGYKLPKLITEYLIKFENLKQSNINLS
jgi:hypothetical protein